MRRCFSLILFILAFAVGPSVVRAEDLQVFSSKENKFSIAYPSEFEELNVPQPEVAFLIRHRENLYPTFNVLVLPGPYDMSQADSKHADSLLNSYKLVGITDVRPIKWFRFALGSQKAFNLELRYRNDGKDLTSSITVATASDRHYILTYIDSTAQWEANKDARAKIIGSFTILEKAPDAAPAALPQGGGSSLMVWVILLALGAGAVFMVRRRGRA
jgi:hypothetical protein